MRIFSQKQNPTQQGQNLSSRSSNNALLALNHVGVSRFHSGGTIGNQPVPKIPQSQEHDSQTTFPTATASRFGHDFSRIPLHASVSKIVQNSRVGDSRGNDREQKPNLVDEYAAGKEGINVNSEIESKSVEARESDASEASLFTDTPPKLTMKTISGPTDGMCGRFRWVIQWVLDKVTAKGGLVVQKLDSKYDVKGCDGKPVMPAKEIYDPSWFPFWEAWEINPGQKVTKDVELGDDSDDTYFRGSKNLDTKGVFSYTGSAEFYEGARLSKTNLKAMHKPPAGDLPMAKTKPKLPTGSGALAHNLKATWDCCSKDKSATKSSNLEHT